MRPMLIMIAGLSAALCLPNGAQGDQTDPTARRLVSSPTALTDSARFTGAVHVHTFFGLAYTVGGSIGYVAPMNERLSLGVVSNIGFMVAPTADEVPFFFGGGPAVAFGSGDFLFNLSTLFYGAYVSDNNTWLVLPSIGVSKKVSGFLRLQAEVVVPILQEKEFDSVQGGAVLYGVRLGKSVFADINFVAPFGGDTADVYKIFPLGIPIISIGTTF